MTKTINQSELKESLYYNPDTGEFYRYSTGRVVTAVNNTGYIHININGKKYLGHRLAFLYMTGKFPEEDVDHINGNRTDNRFSNLRVATKAQNNLNRKLNNNSSSGVKGVTFNKKLNKWLVQLQINKQKMYFGVYSDFELAELVSEEAIKKYHKEFARVKDKNEEQE